MHRLTISQTSSGGTTRAWPTGQLAAASTNEAIATEDVASGGVGDDQAGGQSPRASDSRRPLWARIRHQASDAVGLSGHPQNSPLVRHPRAKAPEAERQLFGVARWPVVCDPKESEVMNRHYGTVFSREALRLGQRIGQQKYAFFTHVWADCRQWRANYENNFGGKDENFGQSRIGTRAIYSTPIVSGQRYAYMVDRIFALPQAQHGLIHAPKRVNGQTVEGTMKVREVRYNATTTLHGEQKLLTQLKAWFEPDGSPLATPAGMPVQIGDIIHTKTEKNYIPLVREANDLFHQAITPGLSPAERLRAMADLHWILAHAMPDRRGSAAKTELAVRAIGYAVGIELPPFAPGVVPDLEAFLSPREEFVSNYETLFSRPPLTSEAVAGSSMSAVVDAGALESGPHRQM